MTNPESSPKDAPHDHVGNFTVAVEEQDGMWAVIKDADGQRSVVDRHPDEEAARRQADLLELAANRYDGAPREEAVPDSYPGKGEDETGNIPPAPPGA